jgi:hypothetical protein
MNFYFNGISVQWVIGVFRPGTIIRKILPEENAMKHHRIYLAIAMLILATLACQAVTGGGDRDVDDRAPATESIIQPQDTLPTEISTEPPVENNNDSNPGSTVSSQFPMTGDAFNVVEVGDGSLVYYTKLSAEAAMQFYRDEYTSRGYTERDELTIVADDFFSMVFDGDPSGKSVVIQSVDLGDGSRTIAIRLEDV